MNKHNFAQALKWARECNSSTPWSDGYVRGYLNGLGVGLTWERTYIENILNARMRGVSA